MLNSLSLACTCDVQAPPIVAVMPPDAIAALPNASADNIDRRCILGRLSWRLLFTKGHPARERTRNSAAHRSPDLVTMRASNL
jgi:hypothetical protein